jgi:hypothetical protein
MQTVLFLVLLIIDLDFAAPFAFGAIRLFVMIFSIYNSAAAAVFAFLHFWRPLVPRRARVA